MILSTIAPPKNQRFSFNGRFVAARYEEGCYEKYVFTYSLFREGLSTDDVEVAKGTAFQEIRPWAGFETGDFVREKLRGRRMAPGLIIAPCHRIFDGGVIRIVIKHAKTKQLKTWKHTPTSFISIFCISHGKQTYKLKKNKTLEKTFLVFSHKNEAQTKKKTNLRTSRAAIRASDSESAPPMPLAEDVRKRALSARDRRQIFQ